MTKILFLFLAGGLGTLCRFGMMAVVNSLLGPRPSPSFPWATLWVNLLGCFLFGLIWFLAEQRHLLQGERGVILLIGFMGAFTTFSTFAFEAGSLLQAKHYWSLIAYLLASNLLGIAAFFAGVGIARQL